MKKGGLKKLVSAVLTAALATTMAATALPSSAMAASAEFTENQKIQNDIFWEDTAGDTIYSEGGGVFKFGDTYYWYGVKYKNAPNYVEDPTKYYTSGDTYSDFESITCYSSQDLVNWTFEGDVVTEADVSYREEMEGVKASWVGRLGVAKVGDTYVMLVQHECDDPDNSIDAVDGYTGVSVTDDWSKQVLVLTSDSPTGKFEWNQRINMIPYTENGTSNTGDQTVFTDPATGKSYLVYSYGVGRGTIWLSEIVYMGNGLYGPSLEKNYKIYKGTGREGDCMFEYNGDYYLCASDLYGWNASHAYYLRLDSLDEEYLENWEVSSSMEVMPGCSDDYCHVSQTGFFYTVEGTEQDTVIFCGDRWAVFAGNGLGFNQWCPLSFDEDGNPYFNSLSSWYLNDETGEWAVAEDNNYVKNGSFDADRISVTELTGWTNTIREGNSPIKNSGNTTTGKYGLALTDSVDFDCTISQEIASNDYVSLPDGSYTMTAQVKNSGNFDNLALYVEVNGMKAQTSVDSANSEWTTVTLENVTVTGGQAEIGIDAAGEAGAYCYVDDITFVRTGDVSEDAGSLSGTIHSDVTGQTLTIEAVQTDGNAKYTYEVETSEGETSFVMQSMAPGTYELKVSAYGCIITPETQEAVVEAGQTTEIADISVNNNMGSLQGMVKDDKGNPVEGVSVTLSGGSRDFEVSTGSDGNYAFTDVEAGDYKISFMKTGYASVSDVTVTVEAKQNTTMEDQVLQMNTGTISGKVYDSSGNPAAGVTVALRGTASVSDMTRRTEITDGTGSYSFTDVVAGTYTLSAYEGDLNDSVNAFAQNVTVESDTETGVNLDLPVEIEIVNGGFESGVDENRQPTEGWTTTGSSGRASNDKSHDHVYSGDYGYTVWTNNSFTVGVSQTITDLENGTYVVNVMATAGDYTDSDSLYLYAKNADGEIISQENIPITDGWEMIGLVAEVTDGTLTIGVEGSLPGGAWANFDDFRVGKIGEVHEAADTGTISGVVTDTSGNPVAGASVAVRGCNSVSDTFRTTTTADEAGGYILENIPEGTYAVSVSDGSWNASVNGIVQDVKVEKQENTQLKLVIPDTVTIVNGGFESGDTTGWSSTGSSGRVSNDTSHGHVYQGNYGYTAWSGSDFTISLEQELSGLTNGTYVVNVTVAAGTFGETDELYLYARNADGEIISRETIPETLNDGWEIVGLTAEVTDGTLNFGISGNMSANAWANFDDFRVGLVSEVSVNKEALNTLIDEVETFDTTVYTSVSVSEYEAAVKEALAEAKTVQKKEDAVQSEVDRAVAALNTAFQTGKAKLVTIREKLENGIAESISGVLAEEQYTAESWATYESALEAAWELTGTEGLTESQADTAIAELEKAVAELELKTADATDLESLIAEVDGFDLTAYTKASSNEYKAAVSEELTAAKELLEKENVQQTELDAAMERLEYAFEEAKAKLVTIESKLTDGIADSIKNVSGQDTYTAESWAAYETKLAEVQALLESETLTEAQADAAIADLQAVIAGMQSAGSKAELAGLIAEVENLNTSVYTEESVAEYETVIADALEAAREVMYGPAVSQDEIDAAVNELQEAFDAAKAVLKVISAKPEDPGTEEQPSDQTGNSGSDSGAQTPGTTAGQNQSADQTKNITSGSSTTSAEAAKTADTFPVTVCAAGAAAAAAAFIVLFRRKRER